MVISNLIPFTKLNLIFAFDFVVNTFIKMLNPTQIGAPTISIQFNVMLLMLVFTNSEARSHFKRKVAAWRGLDLVEVVHLQQEPHEGRQANNQQANNQQASHQPDVNLPNQIIQESIH